MSERKRSKKAPIIRELRDADIEALIQLPLQMSVVEGTLQNPFMPESFRRERLKSFDPATTRILVAEVEGRPVGMGDVHLRPAHQLRMRHVGGIGLSIDENARGRGIGGALLDGLIEIAESWMGILRLELCVFVDNAPAIRLYRDRGFNVEGVGRAYALRDGKLVDVLHMARVAEQLPWPRVTAEDAASPQIKQLPSPKKRNPFSN